MRDAQGNWKLNWSTLLFATNGMDNSIHFINTVAAQQIVGTSIDEKDVRLHVRPDPEKFMDDHNVFNIVANGTNSLISGSAIPTAGVASPNTVYISVQ